MAAYRLKRNFSGVPGQVKTFSHNTRFQSAWERTHDPIAWTRRMGIAFSNGRRQGIEDRHWSTIDYVTGQEWLEHLRGWRAGQAELKANAARLEDEIRDMEIGE